MMVGCKKCMKMSGILMLIVGIIYLLQDLSFLSFWKLEWYTVLFLLWGIGTLSHLNCPDCQALMYGGMKKK